jgi:16S rRNA G966 N2-methylase RsmD
MSNNYPMLRVPFIGNKSIEYNKYVRGIIRKYAKKDAKVLDAFGGSCILAANISRDFPFVKVTANDFDELYNKEYSDMLDAKDAFMKRINELGIVKPKTRARISEKDHENLIKEFERLPEEIQNSKKFQNMLKHNFCFSGLQMESLKSLEHLKKSMVYFGNDTTTLKQRAMIKQLEKVEIIKKDFFDIELEKYDIIILDPPYLNSATKHYTKDFFGLKETIEMLKKIEKLKNNQKIIIFNQKKEDFKALIDLTNLRIIEEHTRQQNTTVGAMREDYCAVLEAKGVTK